MILAVTANTLSAVRGKDYTRGCLYSFTVIQNTHAPMCACIYYIVFANPFLALRHHPFTYPLKLGRNPKKERDEKLRTVIGGIRNHYHHTHRNLTCRRRHSRHNPSSKWACKKKLACEFSLPPFLLSPKFKNFRGPHCLVELSSEPKRKSNSPIVVILKIRLRIIVRANAR